MAAISNYLENKIIDIVLRNTAWTPPATVYLSLHTADVTDAGTGTEVSGNGYAREAITFDAGNNGATANSGVIEFTADGGNWGTVTHIGIWDADTSGNLLFHGALTASKAVNDGDTLEFAAGDIDITVA